MFLFWNDLQATEAKHTDRFRCPYLNSSAFWSAVPSGYQETARDHMSATRRQNRNTSPMMTSTPAALMSAHCCATKRGSLLEYRPSAGQYVVPALTGGSCAVVGLPSGCNTGWSQWNQLPSTLVLPYQL